MLVCLCDVRVLCVASGVDRSSRELLYLPGTGEPVVGRERGLGSCITLNAKRGELTAA